MFENTRSPPGRLSCMMTITHDDDISNIASNRRVKIDTYHKYAKIIRQDTHKADPRVSRRALYTVRLA